MLDYILAAIITCIVALIPVNVIAVTGWVLFQIIAAFVEALRRHRRSR